MKYLFRCEYDNQTYSQTSEDISQTEPTKSAFYDVMDKPIKKFWIEGEGHQYLVDLQDGHFEIDGIPFKMHEEELKDFRIIYYRKHTHQFQGTDEVGHDIEFCIGWQCLDNTGKNIKRILTIQN
jgi:hypothetical protein